MINHERIWIIGAISISLPRICFVFFARCPCLYASLFTYSLVISYNYRKLPFEMGKSTISVAIFSSYVDKLPESKPPLWFFHFLGFPMVSLGFPMVSLGFSHLYCPGTWRNQQRLRSFVCLAGARRCGDQGHGCSQSRWKNHGKVQLKSNQYGIMDYT